MVLGLLCAVAFQSNLYPAFLDARDAITVWIPRSVPAGGKSPSAQVWVDGKQVSILKVEPKGLIAEPSRPRPDMVVVAGSFQHFLGGSDWSPGDPNSEMRKTAPGQYEFLLTLPKGRFEYKVAVGGNWSENYGIGFKDGGANISVEIPRDGTPVRFLFDRKNRRIGDSINDPTWVPIPRSAPTPSEHRLPQSANVFRIVLSRPLEPTQVCLPIRVKFDGSAPRTVFARDVLDDPSFQHRADDLGSRYSRSKTAFRVWTPVSRSVELDLAATRLPMTRQTDGTWSRTVAGDLHGKAYRFIFHSYGEARVAPDINGYGATQDGRWSVVIDPARSNPAGWNPSRQRGVSPHKLTVYEMHIRDFTSDPSSGVSPSWRGKYLGLTQDTKRNTGLNYLKWLGINAVQLMPLQMFNPDHGMAYDWGYDPYLFNVPEPSYGTKPSDSVANIRETKAMIAALHRSGLRVIMDVVYNHSVPSEGPHSPFWQVAPYFFMRTNDRGDVLNESGVGNALDDDHPMVRKYIRDSLCYWVREYAIDGFRFDLLGLFTKASVVDWKRHLAAIDPAVVMYGEPWTGGGPTRFGKGDQRGTGVGVFNDNFRNAIRGEMDGPAPGFALGGSGFENAVIRGLAGSIDDFTSSPDETVNYVSAHDNMTLWDKICLSLPRASETDRKRSLELCGALVLHAQGLAFLEGGAELGRTKGGNRNSYNAGDRANRFDWQRAQKFMDVAATYRKLIKARETDAWQRLDTSAEIRSRLLARPLKNGIELFVRAPGKNSRALFNGSGQENELRGTSLPPFGFLSQVTASR